MEIDRNDPVIVLEGVERSFDGAPALRGLNLRVPRGGIYGFLGRNGAGKTTAIKMIAGLIRPDAGTVRVLGKDPFAFTPEDRQRVGYLSEKQILLATMTVRKVVAFCAPFYPRWDGGLVERLLVGFRIDPKKKISDLSQGGQRQVAFILALAQRPELLILDEPASTLDVVARREFLDEMLELVRQEGPTVFLSSHILSDIERVADQVGIVVDGALKVSESLDNLKETVKRVRFHGFERGMVEIPLPGIFHSKRSGNEILVTARIGDEEEVARLARGAGAQFEIESLSLEDIFVEISRP